ncbi:LPS assembly protein LptD [Thalassotalea hakodatensis]|uniref:LPS assembly protein LptD n=1 Tax=Thalassotalea hakodatensis TaxID=3030492 RepID=UPI0025737757|nr:LPS assembly protein LptD [Thalassotalea hakodatensis]
MHFLRTLLVISTTYFFPLNVLAQTADSIQNINASCPLPTYPTIVDGSETLNSDTYNIWSKSTHIKREKFAKFIGGVTLSGQGQAISADELFVDRTTSALSATGNIHFQNPTVDIFASSLDASKSQNYTELTQSSYQLAGNPGHGSAGNIRITGDGTLTLVDSNFTTCYGEVPDWQIQASEISISLDENHGEAYNARFKLFGVPVFYVPYFSFPVSNERKSGFLYPKFSSSQRTGFQFESPFYWNIAPNMDATITPRYMSKRGLQLLTEFRYLSGQQNGQLNIEYLNKDDELNNDDKRYLARIQHVGTISENIRAYVDYTTISDDNYLVDIKSEQYNSNDAYLYQIGEIAYFSDNWFTKLQLQDFEVLGEHQTSYQTLPHIEFSHFTPLNFYHAEFDIYSEITRFTSNNLALPEADRYHFEAGLTLPISTPAWFLNSELRVLQTNYHQTRTEAFNRLEKSVNRTLPKIRLHGGMNFDRDITYFDQAFTQTLEPQLQYLYIPDEDQSAIGVYDTTTLQDDYDGLFRDRRFSGLDRIAQANQYSWGITSRLLDNDNTEKFRLSVGRIVYLNDTHVSHNNQQIASSGESALASELYLSLNRNWQFSSDIQYNTKENSTNRSQSSLDYIFDNNNTIQLNHRYSKNVSGSKLEQVSLLTSVAVNKNWQFVGRVTQDLKDKRSLESYAGLQYESCCWAVRFAFHRHINSNIDEQNQFQQNRDEFDSGFMIQFIIKGLGGNRQPIDTTEMFNNSIFGYKRPYFLNN